tara:strand:+ start:2008 stop:2220 length:213 start_codon:yes stop_codon:yes gene_type:complete
MPGNGQIDDFQNQQIVEITKTQKRLMDQIVSVRETIAELRVEINLYRKILYAIGAMGASALGMNLTEFMM